MSEYSGTVPFFAGNIAALWGGENGDCPRFRPFFWRAAILAFACLGLPPLARAAADEPPLPVAAAVPDAPAQEKATRMVKELFKDDIDAAKTPAAKLDLAKNLLQKGIDTQGDLAGQYVLLRTARDFAVAAPDAGTAMQVVDEMARSFQIDGLAAKLETLTTLSKTTLIPAQGKALVETTLAVADEAVAADKYDIAKQALALGNPAAKKTRDPELIKQLVNRGKELDALEEAFRKVKAAQDQLDEKPLDPDANLAVGRYRALVKSDWDRGIPLLALGSDAKLKELATLELNDPDSGDDLVKLADAWWDYATTLDAGVKDRVETRSLSWYTKALPQISGLQKLRVEKLLLEMSGKVFARIQYALRAKKVSVSRQAGSNRGARFADVLDEGGLLIGFEIGTIDVGDERFIRSIRPLYRSARGEVSGAAHGFTGGQIVTIKAKEGFAVGGVAVKASSHIEAISLTFMQTEGLGLNPHNSYSSPWVGNGSSPEVHLGGSGAPVVGVAGKLTNFLEALSLISLR